MCIRDRANIVLNDVTSSVRPMMERFQNNPEYPDDMFLNGAKAAELVDAGTMLVVVDVNRPSITDEPSLLRLIRTIVVLDHHRTSSEVIDNAVLSSVEPYASSACEMVAEVLQYLADGIKVDVYKRQPIRNEIPSPEKPGYPSRLVAYLDMWKKMENKEKKVNNRYTGVLHI